MKVDTDKKNARVNDVLFGAKIECRSELGINAKQLPTLSNLSGRIYTLDMTRYLPYAPHYALQIIIRYIAHFLECPFRIPKIFF